MAKVAGEQTLVVDIISPEGIGTFYKEISVVGNK